MLILLLGSAWPQKNRKRAPRIVHEHHIQVLKTWQIDELKEPLCPEPDVSEPFPSARHVLARADLFASGVTLRFTSCSLR